MQIEVRLTGILADYLPAAAGGAIAALEVADGATPLAVARQLGLPDRERYLVVVNEAVVPVAEHDRRTLADGDRLALMPPLTGG